MISEIGSQYSKFKKIWDSLLHEGFSDMDYLKSQISCNHTKVSVKSFVAFEILITQWDESY